MLDFISHYMLKLKSLGYIFFTKFSGVMKGANYVAQSLQFQNSTQEVNIVWSNTYMPPTYKLLRISERSRILKKNRKADEFPSYFLYPSVRVNFHDLGGKVSFGI